MAVVSLAACGLAPGMKFNKRASSPYKASIIQQGQYKIRIVPISRKLIHLQNLNQARRGSLQGHAKGILHANYTYRVGSGDVLSIKLWEDANLSNNTGTGGTNTRGTETVVDSKGYIYFPYAGEVYVKGSSAPEIRRKIHNKMLKYFDSPKITVLLKEYNSQYAMVTGQVNNPGRLAITSQPLTVFSAIYRTYSTSSGGALPTGRWKNATLTRANGSVQNVNLVKLISEGDFSQDYTLRHGDRLHVPLSVGEKVFLLGGGVSAKTFALQNTETSLSDALGSVGGVSDNGNAKAVYVFRREVGRPANEVTAYNFEQCYFTDISLPPCLE